MAHKIDLYGVIGLDWWGKSAKGLLAELQAILDDDTTDNDVELHINSGGGFVDDAVAMHNRLVDHPGKVHVVIDALAASAATLVAMAGDTITIPHNAMMMIHSPWAIAGGSADELRKVAGRLDKTEASMIAMYARHTGLGADEVREMLAAETWLNADEALDLGFVDEVTEPSSRDEVVEARASAVQDYVDAVVVVGADQLPTYKNAPDWADLQIPAPRSAGRSDNNRARMRAHVTEIETMAQQPETSPEKIEAKTVNPEEIARAERERQSRIRALCDQHDVADEVRNDLLDNGAPVAEASERILAHLAERQTAVSSIRVEADASDKRSTGIQRALEMRAGLLKPEEARAERAQNEFSSFSLLEMARAYSGDRSSTSKLEVVRNAFASRARASVGITHTVSDFPTILENVAHKSMLLGWDASPDTYSAWTNRGNLPDFKPMSRVGLNAFPSLSRLEDGAEYKGATIGERGVTIQLYTYGKMFGITRPTIINDDIDALSRIPMAMGAAARRTIADAVYAVLTDNDTFGDEALFHANKNNTHANDLDATGLSTLRAAMRTQKDPESLSALNISPSNLLVPAALENDARVQMAGQIIESGGAGVSNVNAGSLGIIVEPRLDDDSAATWYMLGDGRIYDTVEVAYLDGNDQPFLDSKEGWSIDGVEFKTRIDFGVGARDYRALQRGTGA